MLQAYKLIALSVYEESWALNVRHDVDVAEPVIDEVLEGATRLLPHNISNRHEWAHQEQRARVSQRREQGSWAGTNRSAEENDRGAR